MNRWFQFKFRMVWPDNQPTPRYWLDILIFDIIIREILEKNRNRIELWRIHRRANKKDEDGHQFTFLVYTTEEVAGAMDGEVKDAPVLQALQKADFIDKYFLESETASDTHLVEGKSYKKWSPEVQRSWPYYIMGVSEMLLNLIDQLRGNTNGPQPSDGTEQLCTYYRQLSESIIGLWRQEGNSAFLHQLNAVFAYQPLLVRPRYAQMLLSF